MRRSTDSATVPPSPPPFRKRPLTPISSRSAFSTDALKASARVLAAGIEHGLDLGVDIINLSLGTVNPAHRDLFAALVARAAAQGVLIVAPREANGAPCWPGAIDGVLGVGLDWDVPRDRWRVADGIVYASGHPRPIPGVPQRHNLYGISFATAQASGFAACACAQLHMAKRDASTLRTAMLQPDFARSA